MKVRALIADDEPVARSGLRRLLADVPWLEIAGEADNGPAAVAAIDSARPDVAFLDIQMPGLSGLEVLRRARHSPHVIFTTAYAQHAVTAFELGALDYLLKPFGAARLAAALERVRAALGEPATVSTTDRLAEALSQGPMSRLFVRQGASIIPVAVRDVSWFEADGDYVVAHAGRTRHLMHVALNRLEARLDARQFARVHRAHIVNLEHVTRFRSLPQGRLVAELEDGTNVPVSRAKAKEVRAIGR